jgi:hypothetical protein
VKEQPRTYDLSSQPKVITRQLVSKIHTLNKAQLKLLLSNPSFTTNKQMHYKILELIPPERHKLVFT